MTATYIIYKQLLTIDKDRFLKQLQSMIDFYNKFKDDEDIEMHLFWEIEYMEGVGPEVVIRFQTDGLKPNEEIQEIRFSIQPDDENNLDDFVEIIKQMAKKYTKEPKQ